MLIDGEEISYRKEDDLARIRGQKLGFVFQSYQLIPTLTALENVMLPHELHAADDGRARAEALLESVGLAERDASLSGAAFWWGAAARGLARAFMLRPPVILADEPTGNLDSTNGARIMDLLIDIESARRRNAGAGHA